MGRWDDYCVICGGSGRVEEEMQATMSDLIAELEESGHHDSVSLDFGKLHLNAADRKFTEELVLVGPFDESLDPVISDEYKDADDELLQYPPEEIRVVEGLTIGGLQLGDLVRVSDDKQYTCHSNIYPFTHARCVRLLNDCTMVKTPQQFWQVVRACNGTEWQIIGLRGIDYGEIQKTQEQVVFLFMLLPVDDPVGKFEDWLKYFVFKPVLNQDDMQRFYKELGWLWTTPDVFPVASTILAQNEVPFSLLETVSKTPAQDVEAGSINSAGHFTKLPLDAVLLVAQNLDIVSFLQLSAVNRATFQCLISQSNSTIHIILERTRPWYLPWGEMETKSWDEMITQSGAEEGFPWLLYAKECALNSHSIRNRRRIWKIMKQLEAVAIENAFV